MHKINILVSGPSSFVSTLEEIRLYLKFNLSSNEKDFVPKIINKYDIILFHQEHFVDEKKQQILSDSACIKILATHKRNVKSNIFDEIILLPTTIKEINNTVEAAVAKKKFNVNSSIKVKGYSLDRNQKKLNKKGVFIILTEKEIQLLDLFLNKKKPISKNQILSEVWHYASDADTHTVETHIYRLRKKISEKFSDEKFIQNSKEGYYL